MVASVHADLAALRRSLPPEEGGPFAAVRRRLWVNETVLAFALVTAAQAGIRRADGEPETEDMPEGERLMSEATPRSEKIVPHWVAERLARQRAGLAGLSPSREKSLALTKLEEAEMWALEPDGHEEAVKKLREAMMWGVRARPGG